MQGKNVTKFPKDAKSVPMAAVNTFQPISNIAARLLLRMAAPEKGAA